MLRMNMLISTVLVAVHVVVAIADIRVTGDSPASTSKCIAGTNAFGRTPELCVALNVPNEPDAQNDLFMKVTGPANRQYTGIGFGSGMNDALMLLLFPSANNLSVSMRLGSGHARPSSASSSVSAELLPGSASDGNVFTANVRCRNCRTWSTGSVTTTSKAQDIIYAYGLTTGTGTGDSAVTTYHGPFSRGTFKLDMTMAEGPGGVPSSSGRPSTGLFRFRRG